MHGFDIGDARRQRGEAWSKSELRPRAGRDLPLVSAR